MDTIRHLICHSDIIYHFNSLCNIVMHWKRQINIYYIISYHIISYQTLFQYHTSKQIGMKTQRDIEHCWGHDQKAIKAWENHALNN